VWSTEPPILYFTGDHNFRKELAKQKVYKGQRKHDNRPFYWKYIRKYLKTHFDSRENDILEADDLLAIEQTKRLQLKDTIIVSRDKDLLMVPGYHYVWECAKQPSFGPLWVEDLGEMNLVGKKLKHTTGLRLFYAQLLMGDGVDNITGVAYYGPVLAYEALCECSTEEELHNKVIEVYQNIYGDEWEDKLMEMGSLLWMVRELKEDGSPVIWKEIYEKRG